MTAGPRTFAARWVFPVTGPPLEGGAVTVRGDRIEAVEPRGARAPDEDLGNVALIPGLVNAHTHLDLSGARGLTPPTDPDHFPDWLRGVIAYRRSRTPDQTQADVRAGLAECLRAGTTLIGDIAADGQSWDALRAAPTRSVMFWELIGLSEHRANEALADAGAWLESDAQQAGPNARPGLSPHAPYSFRFGSLHSLSASIEQAAMHVAESPAELQLLATRSGPFVEFLTGLGAWDPTGLAPSVHALLIALTNARYPLVVHGNYLPPNQPGLDRASVVYCPRTHAAFGHPPHPFREFLARGVRVCLGTDSLASNPDLDIFAEAQFVHQRHPDFPGGALLKMVTLSGAEALGWADEVGSLEPGKSADLVALPLPDRDAADPHELLFASAGQRCTMFRGEWR